MNLENDFAEFRRHHRNPWNLAFHILCGLGYLVLFFSLVGLPFLLVYGSLVICLFRWHVTTAITVMAIVSLGVWAIQSVELGVLLRAAGVVVFYLLPELSHWLTREATVLTRDKLTPINLVLNFFMLPPYCIASAYRTLNNR
jgi:hypothetical protein